MNEMYERNLPGYLAHDLEAWKKGVEEINDNAITHEQAQYLRGKYLWGKDV